MTEIMRIDINTKFITLIGDPLSQSFAARMQNAAYRAAGINMQYFYTETGSEHLCEIVNGLRYMPSFAGFAVTKPNKVAVLPFLDELDPLCAKMGACNTVVKRDGKLIGYNTDGEGFYRSILEEMGAGFRDKTVFCFGAGGAGRGICSSLAYHGIQKIYISDIIDKAAEQLAADINTHFVDGSAANETVLAEFVPFGDYTMAESADLVINASGIGMGKTMGQSPMAAEKMHSWQFYYDACYNPAKTQFLKNAESRGCMTANGLNMSLYQGVAQIELWTGKKAPVDVMRSELLKIIQGK